MAKQKVTRYLYSAGFRSGEMFAGPNLDLAYILESPPPEHDSPAFVYLLNQDSGEISPLYRWNATKEKWIRIAKLPKPDPPDNIELTREEIDHRYQVIQDFINLSNSERGDYLKRMNDGEMLVHLITYGFNRGIDWANKRAKKEADKLAAELRTLKFRLDDDIPF